ncbi:hypothetical protein N9R74_02150, partial [bacterium]|nr:hypothetical protein [bacterium]
RFENVHLVLGDSQDTISKKLAYALKNKTVFAYLDAHWQEHLPLRDEIADISALASDFVILIDDFKVPSDDNYEYDDYDQNGACTLEYIAPALSGSMAVFFPTTPAAEESGRKRGYVVIGRGKEIISKLEKIDLLARFIQNEKE